MAHALFWPGTYYFYPVGNTPAVCLTRDVAPRVPTNLLLLGCGDPRNILYTVYCDQANSACFVYGNLDIRLKVDVERALDFTCVDWDGGILARNVLLFSMIVDEIPHQTMWNIFYNMKLDKESYACLVEQSRKLADAAQTPQTWQASRYGRILRMSSNQTLPELRRHWLSYVNMQSLPRNQMAAITSSHDKVRSSVLQSRGSPSARSAGPFHSLAFRITADVFRQYWETGALVANPQSTGPTNLLNPTFFYSRGGEDTNCTHYGTSPIVPFHLAPVFAKGKGSPSVGDIVKDVTSQFATWCSAMSDAIRSSDSSPVVRLFWADALAASQCLKTFRANGKLSINVPVSQWKTQVIELSREEYVSARAPSSFDVVDTSNLVDSLGLLNVLVASIPLLSSPSSSVLYTETLLHIRNDATTEFNEALHADFATFSLLTGVCPVDYLSGFVSRSNVHELFDHEAVRKASSKSSKEPAIGQFHQVTTWKNPSSCYSAESDSIGTVFEPRQLATFLYDMYHSIFETEDAHHFQRVHQENFHRVALSFAQDHYVRESFVLFLKHVKSHLRLLDNHWTEIMHYFFSMHDADKSMPMDKNNSHDLWAQLYRHGLYTSIYYLMPFPTTLGPFSGWPSVPVLSRVVLVVPREKLGVLERSKNTPPMLCYVLGDRCHNVFSSVHVAFGRVVRIGSPANPSVVFEEDKDGFKGSSPLVASFVMPSTVITSLEPPEKLTVHLALRSTTAVSVQFISTLGPMLSVHGSPLMDREHVHILPEQPLPKPPPPSKVVEGKPNWTFGPLSAPFVDLDEECEAVSAVVIRVAIQDPHVQKAFQGGESPQITQHAPCTMRLALGNRTQNVDFPFPVIGSQNKLRLARKSLYIEVVVPLSGGLRGEGLRLNRFPVTTGGSLDNQALHFYPWSVHRVALSSLPTLNIKKKTTKDLLDSHLGAMLSDSERKLLKRPERASSLDIDTTFAFLKETLHTLLVRALGVQQGAPQRVFMLQDRLTNNCDTFLLVNELRLDVANHTVVCDAFVLPLTRALIAQKNHAFAALARTGEVNLSAPDGVMAAWKRLLPALAERCRTWEHGPNCEYAAAGRVPLSEEMEQVPLCSCGAGVDVEEMKADPVWRPFAPHATRVAISPLFAVSYLERVMRDPAAHRCALCRGKGKPKLKACTGCRKIRYCSDT